MGYVPYNSRGVDHIDCDKKGTPKVQHPPMRSGTAALYERHGYFPDEHALPFNQYLLSIYYMYDTDLSSGNTTGIPTDTNLTRVQLTSLFELRMAEKLH